MRLSRKAASKLTITAALTCLPAILLSAFTQPQAEAAEHGNSGPEHIYLPYLGKAALPASPPAGDDWLAHLNYYRAIAHLPPVNENPGWSSGNWLHSRYSVKNDQLQHSENPGNPWYTPDGNAAAGSSNLFGSFNTFEDDSTAITWWISGPFHAVGLLTPQLLETGYGSYREGDGGLTMAAGIDIVRGVGEIPSSVSFPVRWPGEGALVYLTQHAGEIPDPLTSCPGYSHPTGLPILLQLGPGHMTPGVTSTSVLEDGAAVEHCVFDETSYSNPNSGYQSLGRGLLAGRDAVVLIPRNPLVPGAEYTVSVTESGTTHTWTFKTATTAAGLEGAELSWAETPGGE